MTAYSVFIQHLLVLLNALRHDVVAVREGGSFKRHFFLTTSAQNTRRKVQLALFNNILPSPLL